MKRIVLILTLVIFSVALANPIMPQLFSELYFDSTGWKIEIIGSRISPTYRIVIMSSTDSAVTNTSFNLVGEYPVITPLDMETPLNINPSGDHLRIGTLNQYGLLWYNDFTFGENGVIAAPRSGESIAFGGGIEASEYKYYLDNTPTLGVRNDCENSKGIIRGIVTNTSGTPVSGVAVKYSVTCSGSENTTAITDENGRFEFECLTARQMFTFRHEDYEFLRTPVQIWPDSTLEMTFVLTTYPINYQSYFPLQVGNHWCYRKETNGIYSGYESIDISETISINDKVYYVLGNDTVRYDSLKNVVIYKNKRDLLLYPLGLSDGDSLILTPDSLWMAKLTYDQTPLTVEAGTFTDNIIIENTFIGTKAGGAPPDTIRTYFTKNVGIVRIIKNFYFLTAKSIEKFDLFYANVNGITYPQTGDKIEQPRISTKYKLTIANYPNPFNSSTTLKYHLPESGDVRLSVFDLNGRLVEELFSGRQSAGNHHYLWSGGNLPSGVYFISLISSSQRVIQKCMLLK